VSAPGITALYRSPVFLELMARLTGKPMYLKSEQDDHACATYEYTRAGDGMKFHYDTCGCDEGASYSMIIPLVNRSTQQLICDLHRKDPGRTLKRLTLTTRPGSMVLFCGSKVWHGVTPLGKDERRIVLSLSYASKPEMPAARRLSENVKDALLYFGPSALWQRNYGPAGGAAETVLVTGASSGIGEAVAHEYAARHAKLALFARREDRLQEVAASCRKLGAREVIVLPGDTTDRATVDAAADRLANEWPRIDRAFLNAGGYGQRDREGLAKVRDNEWTVGGFSADAAERVMRLNYGGVVMWLERVLERMRAQRSGTVVFTGAQAADRGYPKHGPYAASKAALRALADALRADARRWGVRVVLVEPGCVESGLTEAHCCDDMPFLQPTDKSAKRIVRGVEAGEAVVRFPWHGSLLSRLAAVSPRALFDRWAMMQFREAPPDACATDDKPREAR
jgi:NADP-dependent 3-hydroxy acid dehydrogenase YdfG